MRWYDGSGLRPLLGGRSRLHAARRVPSICGRHQVAGLWVRVRRHPGLFPGQLPGRLGPRLLAGPRPRALGAQLDVAISEGVRAPAPMESGQLPDLCLRWRDRLRAGGRWQEDAGAGRFGRRHWLFQNTRFQQFFKLLRLRSRAVRRRRHAGGGRVWRCHS